MAILKTYEKEKVTGLSGNDIPARIFCARCGALISSSKYEPEKEALCARCAKAQGARGEG